MSKQLTAHIKRYRGNLLTVAQHSCATLATAVHGETPRDTGAAQDSWRLVIGGVDRSPQGGNFLSSAKRMRIGQEFKMYSGIHYIRKLEYGSSKQAPSGMLRINAARWPQIVAFSASQIQ